MGLIPKIYEELMQLNSKNKQAILSKNGQRPRIDIFQRRHTDGNQVHENMLHITNHQENANHSDWCDISPHTSQNGYYQKDNR